MQDQFDLEVAELVRKPERHNVITKAQYLTFKTDSNRMKISIKT